MFKKLFIAIALMFFVIGIAACAPSNTAEVNETDNSAKIGESYVPEDSPEIAAYDIPPESFTSETKLKTKIKERRARRKKKPSNVVTKDGVTQEEEPDIFSTADITEYYRPGNVFKGFTLERIDVNDNAIVFWYWDKNHKEEATFISLRDMSPQKAMSGLDNLGAVSYREIEYNGINYVFLGWVHAETGTDSGYSIHWVRDGKAFRASIPEGHTDEEILAFCDYQVVKAE